MKMSRRANEPGKETIDFRQDRFPLVIQCYLYRRVELNGSQISRLGICEDNGAINKIRSTRRNRLFVGNSEICWAMWNLRC